MCSCPIGKHSTPDFSTITAEISVWLTVDFTAKRYGVLPSQLLREGDTIDIECANIAVGYETFVRENPGIKTNHGLSQDQLLQRIKEAKRAQDTRTKLEGKTA